MPPSGRSSCTRGWRRSGGQEAPTCTRSYWPRWRGVGMNTLCCSIRMGAAVEAYLRQGGSGVGSATVMPRAKGGGVGKVVGHGVPVTGGAKKLWRGYKPCCMRCAPTQISLPWGGESVHSFPHPCPPPGPVPRALPHKPPSRRHSLAAGGRQPAHIVSAEAHAVAPDVHAHHRAQLAHQVCAGSGQHAAAAAHVQHLRAARGAVGWEMSGWAGRVGGWVDCSNSAC